MAIHYSTAIDGEMLLVHTSGFDESLVEVQDYGRALIQACLKGGFTRALCDERELEYRLGTLDTYQAAKVARVAMVCNPKGFVGARFWENVAVNRGLSVRAFQDPDTANQWLRLPEAQPSPSA